MHGEEEVLVNAFLTVALDRW